MTRKELVLMMVITGLASVVVCICSWMCIFWPYTNVKPTPCHDTPHPWTYSFEVKTPSGALNHVTWCGHCGAIRIKKHGAGWAAVRAHEKGMAAREAEAKGKGDYLRSGEDDIDHPVGEEWLDSDWELPRHLIAVCEKCGKR